jgi:hypothetical protein
MRFHKHQLRTVAKKREIIAHILFARLNVTAILGIAVGPSFSDLGAGAGNSYTLVPHWAEKPYK